MDFDKNASPSDSLKIAETSSGKLKLALLAGGVLAVIGGVVVLAGIGRAKGHIQTLYNTDRQLQQVDTATLQYIQTLEQRIAVLEGPKPILPPPPTPEPESEDQVTPEEVEALQTYLDYSDEDLAQLEESLITAPSPLPEAKSVEWDREPGEEFLKYRAMPAKRDEPVFDSATNAPLRTIRSLNPPSLTVDATDTQHPVFTISGAPDGAELFLEIDSSSDFDSRNLVRYPSLAPLFTQVDNMQRQDQTFQLFQARSPGWPTAGEDFVLPFRVSSFALEFDDMPTFTDFAHYAQLLTFGLSRSEAIPEVMEIVARRTDHGGASFNLSPLETFISGVDECGHVNELFGAILEISGLRYRGVSGFNPWVKTIMSGAGHSAIEVADDDGTWEYADAFLNYRTPGESAADFSARDGEGPGIFTTPPQVVGKMGLDSDVNVSDLFKYRRYFDKAGRQVTTPVSWLLDDEDRYGRDIPLRPLTETETFDPQRDLPRNKTIHARARYVISSQCDVRLREGCSDLDAIASPWTSVQFTIRPRALLTGATSN